MSDRPLVERLRGPDWNVCDKHTVCYCIEAADAIERMEEKCRIADLHEDRRATELMEAKRKVAELEEDRARLDWLDQWSTVAHRDGDDYWVVVPIEGAGFSRDETLRAALDAARNPRRLRW